MESWSDVVHYELQLTLTHNINYNELIKMNYEYNELQTQHFLSATVYNEFECNTVALNM